MSSRDNDRRLRVQYPNALYHVTSRGVLRRNIYRDDLDRETFFHWMERTVDKFGWPVYAIALMSNHFHLYFRTPDASLSRGAQYLLGGYREDSSATLQEIAAALGLSRRDCVPKLLKKAQLAEPNSDIMRRMEATRRRLKCLMDSAILF